MPEEERNRLQHQPRPAYLPVPNPETGEWGLNPRLNSTDSPELFPSITGYPSRQGNRTGSDRVDTADAPSEIAAPPTEQPSTSRRRRPAEGAYAEHINEDDDDDQDVYQPQTSDHEGVAVRGWRAVRRSSQSQVRSLTITLSLIQ